MINGASLMVDYGLVEAVEGQAPGDEGGEEGGDDQDACSFSYQAALYLITDYIVLGEKQIPYPSEGQKVDTEKIIHSEFYFW